MTFGEAYLSLKNAFPALAKDKIVRALTTHHWNSDAGPVMQSVRLDLAATELRRMMGERA